MSTLILRPNAASVTGQLRVGGTNDNYEAIDESTLDEADYCWVSGGSLSDTRFDIYGFPDHSSETGTINSVTVKAYCKKVIKGTSANNVMFRPVVKISTTSYYGSSNNLTASTALYSNSWATNPATSSAWTWTNIDDLLAGDELTSNYTDKSNNVSSYCYQLWVEVDYGESGSSPVFLPNIMKHNFIGGF
jgi:hypothetical protein